MGGHQLPWWKHCTVVAVWRASSRWPISRQGIEYSVVATLAWMSGPTLAVAQLASTNTVAGSASSASASTAANTLAGAAPCSGRHDRWPATCWHQSSAACCSCSSEANSRPRQNESRMSGMGRSTRGLSVGLPARAGSISTP
jgi:hypothetical protein